MGIRRNNNSDDNQEDGFGSDQDWIAWEATFDHRVCRVTSNADGSVVVASTAGGTVSLLRGSDGKVLATRRVYAVGDEDEEGECCYMHVCWGESTWLVLWRNAYLLCVLIVLMKISDDDDS